MKYRIYITEIHIRKMKIQQHNTNHHLHTIQNTHLTTLSKNTKKIHLSTKTTPILSFVQIGPQRNSPIQRHTCMPTSCREHPLTTPEKQITQMSEKRHKNRTNGNRHQYPDFSYFDNRTGQPFFRNNINKEPIASQGSVLY